jgi:hypothetical protein
MRYWPQDKTVLCPFCRQRIDAFGFYAQHYFECKERVMLVGDKSFHQMVKEKKGHYMTQAQMEKHLNSLQEAERAVRAAGQAEYAHEDSNAFRNFESLAKELNLPREKVLWIYLRKHMDGILAHLNGHRSQREPVHGRIMDARMYLALLDGMLTEDEEGL